MKLKQSILIALSLALAACGEPELSITEHLRESYEPRIVVQGTLFPHQPVRRIKISRNFPLDTRISNSAIVISDADAVILDENNTVHRLTYDPNTGYYGDKENKLVVDYGKTYTIQVSATVAGTSLTTSSSTTVPDRGFQILESESTLGSMAYRELDQDDERKFFRVTFNRSPSIDFYAYSVTALDSDTSTFIYDNAFEDVDSQEVLDDIADFRYHVDWIQDTPRTAGKSEIIVFWFYIWFYGDYQAVIYAGDKNFKDFFLTHEEVKEIDGNFHEAAFHFEGEGIGVFASAIADTVFFRVTR